MTTLAALKAEIDSDDFDAGGTLDTQIASEITKAIRYYQNTRFYFNETRDETFDTVSGQELYTSSDDAAIPKFIEIDQITLEESTEVHELDQISPQEWELLTATGSSTGRPESYCYFNQSIGLYPIPDGAYTIRMIGHIMKDAPVSDDETGNVWMTEAYELIRARATKKVARRTRRDLEIAAVAAQDEAEELSRLSGETAVRVGTGFTMPTEF